MKRIIIPGVLLLLLVTAAAQKPDHPIVADFEQRKNKALAELKLHKNADTARIQALLKLISTAMISRQKKEMESYYEEALLLSRNLGFTEGLITCYKWKATYCWGLKEYTTAHIYFDSAINSAGSPGHVIQESDRIREQVAASHRLKGIVYIEQDNFYAALNHFFESLKYYEAKADWTTAMAYQNISNAYLHLNNTRQALYYARKNAEFCEKNKLPVSARIQAWLSVADVYMESGDQRQAMEYLDKIQPFMPDPQEVMLNTSYYINRGRVYLDFAQNDSALANFKLAFLFAEKSNHTLNKTGSLSLLYTAAMRLGRTEEARGYVNRQVSEAATTGKIISRINAMSNLADFYQKTGNREKGYALLRQAFELKDSFIAENNTEQINRLAASYETEKKQKEILRLQNEKNMQSADLRQQSVLNKVYIAAITGLLILGYFIFRYYAHKQQLQQKEQEIQQQKIKELEKDKHLLTIEAMLRGQEEERSRIAKDLHDGLGGLLSGVKLSFMSLREKVPVSPEGESGFEHSTKMLDRTIVELRKVAHNLMPEILMKFGLEEALGEFCHSIETSSGIHMIYQQLGKDRKLTAAAESAVYRIVQELVNNVLKHADASEVVVQLTKHAEKVTIAVEDNGIGFDTAGLLSKTGAGIINIQHRVNYFKGMIDIDSAPGKGTSVTIELFA